MTRAILTAALLLALPFSAHGVIGVDSSGNTTGAVVYAKETLSKSDTITKEGTTYFVVNESTRTDDVVGRRRILELEVRVPVRSVPSAGNREMVLTLELEGMVLGRNLDLSNAGNANTATYGEIEGRDPINIGSARSHVAYTLLSGGKRGDSSLTIGMVNMGGNAYLQAGDSLFIRLGKVGILPDTPGTIRVRIGYVFAGTRISDETVIRNAVKAMNLLEVSSTTNNATVDVSGEGTTFQADNNVRDDGKAVNVGMVTADAAMTFTALDPFDAPYIHLGGNRVLAADGAWIVSPSRSVPTSRRTSGTLQSILGSSASIEIEGQTDFLGEDGKVFVSPNANCSPSRSSLVEDDGISAPLSAFAGDGGYVCIEVDGETTIPETMPYTATVKHESTTAAFPFPETTYSLGEIGYGGSTIRIPFLSTNDSYNHRIVAVNRSGRPANYTMTFQSSGGTDTVATPEDAATGTFPVGRTILLARDVVAIEDGDHTAATLSIVAPPDKVDVATVLTNRNDGSTDSVVYDTE